jgi:hypothetical protein
VEASAPVVAFENSRRQEVNMLGVSIFAAPTWWRLLLATYAYLLPLVLYVAWVSIAIWDLIRQDEAVSNRRRMAWMAAVLVVPLLGRSCTTSRGAPPSPDRCAGCSWPADSGSTS